MPEASSDTQAHVFALYEASLRGVQQAVPYSQTWHPTPTIVYLFAFSSGLRRSERGGPIRASATCGLRL